MPTDKYAYGRKVGLADYCSDRRARSDAKDGKTDSICLAERVPPYQRAYAEALDALKKKSASELSDVQKSKEQLQKKEDKLHGQLQQIDQQTKTAPTN